MVKKHSGKGDAAIEPLHPVKMYRGSKKDNADTIEYPFGRRWGRHCLHSQPNCTFNRYMAYFIRIKPLKTRFAVLGTRSWAPFFHMCVHVEHSQRAAYEFHENA